MPPLDTLAAELVRLCTERGLTLAFAESCTGGGVMAAITSVSGASAVLKGGFVTYTNEMKTRLLFVSEQVLLTDGAVSTACAAQMAEGARRATGAALALSVTGFAGPQGGREAPVGTVCIGLCSEQGTQTHAFCFSGTREEVRRKATEHALSLLLSHVGTRSATEHGAQNT